MKRIKKIALGTMAIVFLGAVASVFACSAPNEHPLAPPVSAVKSAPAIPSEPPTTGPSVRPEDRALLREFLAQRDAFKNLDKAAFLNRFGDTTSYVQALDFNPLAAKNMGLIDKKLKLSPAQRDTLAQNGFVILKNSKSPTMYVALGKIHGMDLPIYFSADVLLDALHLSVDRLILKLESDVLADELMALLREMEKNLQTDAFFGAAPLREKDEVRAWIGTAQALLKGAAPVGQGPVKTMIRTFFANIKSGELRKYTFFGQEIMEDFGRYKPRGHYTRSVVLGNYYRAMRWLQLSPFSFTDSKSHALAAAMLAHAMTSGAARIHLETLNEVVDYLFGAAHSLSPAAYLDALAAADIRSLSDFTDARFTAFARTAKTSGLGQHPVLSTILSGDVMTVQADQAVPPPVYHMLEPRVPLDAMIAFNVSGTRTPVERPLPSPLDIWFVLGDSQVLPLLSNELETYRYYPNLAALSVLEERYGNAGANGGLADLWLESLKKLGATSSLAGLPDTLKTRAWQRRLLQTKLASWTQLKRDTMLYSVDALDGWGCLYPDGWVDPYPEFYASLETLAQSSATRLTQLGKRKGLSSQVRSQLMGIASFWNNYKSAASELGAMAQRELKHLPLTKEQVRYLNESLDQYQGVGWYPEILFDYGPEEYEVFDPVITEVFTRIRPQGAETLYAGTGSINLMVITVKVEDCLRAYVGPVMSYHEFKEASLSHLTDAEWKKRLVKGGEFRPAWTTDFTR